MKTIFKGYVNGQEFDDVKSYNEALTKALKQGNSVNAHSETKSVEDTEKNCCPYDCFEELAPEYDTCFNDESYIDRLVCGEEETDAWAYAAESERLKKRFDDIKSLVDNNEKDIDVAELTEAYEGALEDVEADEEDNHQCSEELEEELKYLEGRKKEVEDRAKVLRHAQVVIDLYKEHFSKVIEYLETKLNKPCGDIECNCKECQKQQEESCDDLKGCIERLMKMIFK